jgi:drug/metabolite transporter (DMT)-like permease
LTIAALPYIVVLGIIFGTTLVVSRFSVGQFDALLYAALQMLLAGFCYLAFFVPRWFRPRAGRPWPRGRSLWLHSTLLGSLGTALPMSCMVAALDYQSSGVTSVLITASPAMTVVIAHFFLPDERLTRRKVAGVLVALAGALVLTLRGESGLPDVSRASPIGYGLVLTSMLVSSIMAVYVRKYMRELDSVEVASIRMWVAAAIAMPVSLLLVGFDLSGVDSRGFLALLYASIVGTFVGLLLAIHNIKQFGATAAAMTAYVVPIVATIGGVLFLGEQVTGGMLVGMALIIAGVAMLNRRAGPHPRLV